MLNLRAKMLLKALLPYAYVALQFACIGAILLTGPVIARNPVLLVAEILFIGLGLWAIAVMRIGRFNIAPTIAHHARLVTAGPYRLIRHPMYTAVLGSMLSLVADAFTTVRGGIWLALLIVLIGKIRYEEHLLEGRFDGYGFYEEKTRRIIPFIY